MILSIIKHRTNQSGSTLIVSLVMLLLLTLIGLAGMQSSVLQEKMSIHAKDRDNAFQAAESALREAETWILNLTAAPLPEAICATKPCVMVLNNNAYIEQKTDAWWTTNGSLYSTALNGNFGTPLFIVEFIEFIPDSPLVGFGIPPGTYFYRVSSKANGTTAQTSIVLQTTVVRRF